MSNVLEKIEEIFASPNQFSPENMERLINETFSFFQGLRSKLHSKDENERKEAVEMAGALKVKLEEKAKLLCEASGMDPSMLQNYLNERSNFSDQEWGAIQQAKSEIESLKQEIATPPMPVRKKQAKTVKEWIAS